MDTGILDNDSKWRQAVGEITPDYQDVLFPLGFGGIIKLVEEKSKQLNSSIASDQEKIEFYESVRITAEGIIKYANRYADTAKELAEKENDENRKVELLEISKICRKVPEHSPETFREAIQFVWFTQIGGILSENPLSLNPGRFDQYMNPFYEKDLQEGRITQEQAQELIDCLWLKYSEWVWTISANTADYFAGYNQFQNLTVGGKTREGADGTNAITYMGLDNIS